MRDRTLTRLTELHNDRAAITAQLGALTADAPDDHALLDELPVLASVLRHAPEHIRQQLYSREKHQVTIRATIATSTPETVAAIIADSHHDTQASGSHLSHNPGTCTIRTTDEVPASPGATPRGRAPGVTLRGDV
jgi:hypothetical protein